MTLDANQIQFSVICRWVFWCRTVSFLFWHWGTRRSRNDEYCFTDWVRKIKYSEKILSTSQSSEESWLSKSKESKLRPESNSSSDSKHKRSYYLGLEKLAFYWSMACSRALATPRPGAEPKKTPRGWSTGELQCWEHAPALGAAATENEQRGRFKMIPCAGLYYGY